MTGKYRLGGLQPFWAVPRTVWQGLVRCFVSPPASPWWPVSFYVPIALLGILGGILAGLPWWACIGLPLIGLLFWTLLEYAVHSLAFHHTIRFLRLQAVQASHARHHDAPNDPRYMFAQFSLTLPVAIILLFSLLLLMGSLLAAGLVLSGVILGYLAYEVIHYQIHRRRKSRWLPRALVRHHLYHHHKNQARCYGVTSPLWDWIFRTSPPRPPRRRQAGPPRPLGAAQSWPTAK